MANEKFSEFTVQTDLSNFTGLVGFQTNTANYYITKSNFYDDLEANLDLTDFTTISGGAIGDVLTVNGAGTGLEWSAPASGGVSSISFGSTGLTPNTATTGVVGVAGTLVVGHGGTGLTSYTIGDIVYADTASTLTQLNAGTATHVLTSNGPGVAPSYQAVSGGGGGKMVSTASIQGWKEATTGFGVPMATWGAGGSGTGGRKDLGFWVAPFDCTIESFEARWGHNVAFSNGGNNPIIGLYKITDAAWDGALDIGNSGSWGSALQSVTIPNTGATNDYWRLESSEASVSLSAGDAIAIFMDVTATGSSDADSVIWLFVNYTYS